MMKRIKIIWGIVALIGTTFVGCNKEEPIEKIPINEIPDMGFRNYLLVYFDTDVDGFISTKEAKAVKEIDISDLSKYGSIASLKGIEYLTSLEKLNISGQSLEPLDLSDNLMLEVLICRDAGALDLMIDKNINLKEYYCSGMRTGTLNLNNNKELEILDCSNMPGLNLDITENVKLKELYCFNIQVKTLDLSKNTALEILDCSDFSHNNNFLETIDLSNNKRLRIIKGLRFDAFPFSEYKYLEEFNGESQDLLISDIPLRRLNCISSYNSINISNLPDLEFMSITSFGDANPHTLDLTKSTKLKSLTCIGVNCKVDISNCTALEELKWVSHTSNAIDISKNKTLKTLYYACDNILDISNNTALETLEFHHRNGRVLSFENNTLLKNVMIDLKDKEFYDFSNNTLIENLNLTGWVNSEKYYSVKLDISNCKNLTYLTVRMTDIDSLDLRPYSKLKTVYMENCENLVTINAVNLQNLESFKMISRTYWKPDSVEADFSYCVNLKDLSLSGTIKSLKLTGCTSLEGWGTYPR